MTDQPTTLADWLAQCAAVTNWEPWPITDPDTYWPFSDEAAAANSWAYTRGLDPNRIPVATTLDYGTDEHGRRTVTLDLFALTEDGRKVLLPDAEQTEDRAFRYEQVTVLDEPADGAA